MSLHSALPHVFRGAPRTTSSRIKVKQHSARRSSRFLSSSNRMNRVENKVKNNTGGESSASGLGPTTSLCRYLTRCRNVLTAVGLRTVFRRLPSNGKQEKQRAAFLLARASTKEGIAVQNALCLIGPQRATCWFASPVN